MEYTVLLEKRVVKQLRSLSPETSTRIANALEALIEGQGFRTTKDGDVVSFKFQGVVLPTGPGWAGSFRGTAFYWTSSQKLAAANRVAGVYEAQSDENGNLRVKSWRWK